MNWALFGACAISVPVLIMFREQYNRLDIDLVKRVVIEKAIKENEKEEREEEKDKYMKVKEKKKRDLVLKKSNYLLHTPIRFPEPVSATERFFRKFRSGSKETNC